MVGVRLSLDDLPSSPHVLLQVLEQCQRQEVSEQQLAGVILLDAVLAGKLLSLASDQLDYSDVEQNLITQAIARLGMDTVRSIVIDSARVLTSKPLTGPQDDYFNAIWRRSILGAKLASAYAILTQFGRPGEAYLAGLLQETGRLRLLHPDGVTVPDIGLREQEVAGIEREELGSDHGDWGYHLIRGWGVPGFLADAIRYHHCAVDQVADAHHLVKLACVASGMSSDVDDEVVAGIGLAHELFGISRSLSKEILAQARSEANGAIAELVERVATQSDDAADSGEVDALALLRELLDEMARIESLGNSIQYAVNETERLAEIRRLLRLGIGAQDFVLLRSDEDCRALAGYVDGLPKPEDEAPPDWSISLDPARSRIARSVTDRRFDFLRGNDTELAVVDRQLLDFLGDSGALVLPVFRSGEALGVVVASGDAARLEECSQRKRFLGLFCELLARMLGPVERRSDVGDGETVQRSVREMVHEVSNPLGIIRNYLSVLERKLERQDAHFAEIGIIAEEVDRAGELLKRFRDPQALQSTGHGPVDVNRLVAKLLEIYRESMLEPRGIEVTIELATGDTEVAGDKTALQQVVGNLLTNAVEAVDDGGQIHVATENDVNLGGRDYLAILIRDDGPGLPEEVRRHIFKPVQSTKGGAHAGLGLSIAKNIVDKMNGTILYKTGAGGTEFNILLPKADKQQR